MKGKTNFGFTASARRQCAQQTYIKYKAGTVNSFATVLMAVAFSMHAMYVRRPPYCSLMTGLES
jgi:hypothetical protein